MNTFKNTFYEMRAKPQLKVIISMDSRINLSNFPFYLFEKQKKTHISVIRLITSSQ